MRGEADDQVFPGCNAELILNFRCVAVGGCAVCLDVLVDLAEQVIGFCTPACTGYAGFGIYDDGGRVKKSFFQEGIDAQDRAGGVAAGIGYEPCVSNLVPIDFT